MTAPLDVPGLEALLRAKLPAEELAVTSVAPVAGGYSREMYRVDARVDGRPRSFVTRQDPPADKAVIDTPRDQGWAVLAALTAMPGMPIPPARCYDATGQVAGSKMIVSDLVESTTLRAVLAAGDETARPARARKLAAVAAAIHGGDLEALNGTFPPPGDWDAYLDARM